MVTQLLLEFRPLLKRAGRHQLDSTVLGKANSVNVAGEEYMRDLFYNQVVFAAG